MQPRLICLGGEWQGEVISMTGGIITVGRQPENSLALFNPAVSRHHCTLRQTETGEIELVDHDSRNGTFVNGIPVKSRLLEHGDRIRIGTDEFQFVLAEETPTQLPSAILRQSPLIETRAIVQLRPQDAAYLRPDEIPDAAASPGRSLHHLRVLLRLSSLIRTTEGVDALAKGIMEVLFDTVPATDGGLLMLEAEAAVPSWSYGWRRETGPAADVEVPSELALQSVGQEVGILSNLPTSEGTVPDLRSVLVAPLAGKERPIGVLFLVSDDSPTYFDEEHLQVVTAVGRIAGLALDDARAVDQLRTENRRLRQEVDLDHGMVGESAAMQRIFQFIGKVAPSDSTVLITGESGTGKELVARAVHRNSRRSNGPFVAVNCAALTATLLESELFGHEKGAFTGAISQKPGKFELAEGGTVFLDEIGELSADLQAKLLRVLQEREFERVGGTRTIRVSVRVIAATNRDLRDLVSRREFREDLYYRLDVVSVRVPALRERREDIPLLASYFVSKYAARSGRRIQGLASEARRMLAGHEWPGNVRELENAIERAVVLGSSDSILGEDLPETITEQVSSGEAEAVTYLDAVRKAKQDIVLGALEAAHGNQMKAASALDVHHTYLSRLIRSLGVKEKASKLRNA